MDGHPQRFSTDFEQTLSDWVGIYLPRRGATIGCPQVPLGTQYVTTFGEGGVPTPGLEGGAWCNPLSDFGRKDAKFGTMDNLFVSSNSIPPYLRTT